jgi:hypothetical protein
MHYSTFPRFAEGMSYRIIERFARTFSLKGIAAETLGPLQLSRPIYPQDAPIRLF